MRQMDFFAADPTRPPKSHVPSDFKNPAQAPEGSPEYRAVHTMIQMVSYTNLSNWQRKVLWPWLQGIRDEMQTVQDPAQLRFMLGYVVGALEVEQLRSRSKALEIAEAYGVRF